MIARYAGTCPLCGERWAREDNIWKWCGKWCHAKCQQKARDELATVTVVVDGDTSERRSVATGGWDASRQTIRPRSVHGKGIGRVIR